MHILIVIANLALGLLENDVYSFLYTKTQLLEINFEVWKDETCGQDHAHRQDNWNFMNYKRDKFEPKAHNHVFEISSSPLYVAEKKNTKFGLDEEVTGFLSSLLKVFLMLLLNISSVVMLLLFIMSLFEVHNGRVSILQGFKAKPISYACMSYLIFFKFSFIRWPSCKDL